MIFLRPRITWCHWKVTWRWLAPEFSTCMWVPDAHSHASSVRRHHFGTEHSAPRVLSEFSGNWIGFMTASESTGSICYTTTLQMTENTYLSLSIILNLPISDTNGVARFGRTAYLENICAD